MSRPRLDPFAVVAVVIVLVVVVVYLAIMREEGDTPVAWFLAALLLGAIASGYGANLARPHRGAALVLAAVVLGAVGVLAQLSGWTSLNTGWCQPSGTSPSIVPQSSLTLTWMRSGPRQERSSESSVT